MYGIQYPYLLGARGHLLAKMCLACSLRSRVLLLEFALNLQPRLCAVQAVVQHCHSDGLDLSAAGLTPGMQLNAASLSADQAVGLLGLIPASPTSPALTAARQALALSSAQATAHEAAYCCTVSLHGAQLCPLGLTAWMLCMPHVAHSHSALHCQHSIKILL